QSNTVIRSLDSHRRVSLTGGSLSLTSDSSLSDGLDLSGGTVTGAGNVLLSGAATWNSGTLGGTGRLVIAAQGQLDIQTDGTHYFQGRAIDSTAGPVNWLAGSISGVFDSVGQLNIGGAVSKRLNGTINQAGTRIWTGGRFYEIYMGDGAVFNNRSDSLFEARNDASAFVAAAGSRSWTFNNAGTLRKTQSTETLRFFNNLNAGRFINTGTIDTQTGTISIEVPTTLNAGSTILGPGTTQISNEVNVTGPASVLNLTFSGRLYGAGDLTVNGTFLWGGDRMDGPGSVIITQTGQLTMQEQESNYHFGGRTINNSAGPVNWLAGSISGVFNSVGRLNIGGTVSKRLNGTINQAGTTIWTGAR